MSNTALPPLDWNGPQERPFRRIPPDFLERPVFAVFAEVAQRWPERPALHCRQGITSYAALLAWAQRIGAALSAHSPPGSVVGLALPVDHRFPAALLGTLGAGQITVPLDLSQPAERLAHIVSHAGITCVLACPQTRAPVEPLLPPHCTVLDVEALRAPPGPWQPCGRPDDTAYVLYTSGTTGRPKGVYQTQRGLMHDVMQYTNSVHFSELDVTSLLYSPGVNGALRDLYGALLNGGCLCMVDLRRDGFRAAAERLAAAGITVFHAMPPVLRSLLREVRDPAMLQRVRLAYVAGDRLWGRDVQLLRQRLPPGSHLYTGIGSTECATLYRQWFIPSDWPAGDGVMPVGYPLPDRRLRLLREDGREAEPGEPGLITVQGATLARGYWRDPAATAAVFRPEADESGLVTFHTGDRGILRADGLLEFLGRGDRQVKVRGYRVELVEVEGVMRGVPGVEEAGVVAVGEGERMALAGFVQQAEDPEAAATRVQQVLEQRLPSFMQPALLVGMEALPRLGNGKPDLQALQALAAQRLATQRLAQQAEPLPPTPPAAGEGAAEQLEQLVRQEWQRQLGPAGDGEDRRWDRSGGDSLRALAFTVALERRLGVHLPPNLIDNAATWPTVVARLASTLVPTADEPSPASRAEILGDLYIIPWAPGAAMHHRQLAEALAARFRTQVLDLATPQQELQRIHSIPDLARDCAEAIDGWSPPGQPICLVGISFGGRIAVELAAQLRARGHRVAMVGVIDIACKEGSLQLARRAMQIWVNTPPPGMGWWRRRWRTTEAWLQFHAGAGFRWLATRQRQHWLPWVTRIWLLLFGQSKAGLILANIRQAQIASWNPPWHPGELALFITDDTRAILGGDDPTFGWQAHAASVRVVAIDGNHGNLLSGEHRASLVQRLMGVAVESVARAGNDSPLDAP
jgi:amino acid adenylation domain-containing protein